MSFMIGVDVGGTFTDFSVFNNKNGDLFHFKHSSTPEDPSRSIINGIQHILEKNEIKPEEVVYLAHGTTVSTNALIEKKGARIGLITTRGFKNLMDIGWQRRPSMYDLLQSKPESLIPDGLKCEIEERIMYDGSIKTSLNEESVYNAVRYLKENDVKAIAVCTLFSFINPVHEKRIKEIIIKEFPDAYISISSELIPEFREYTRMSTTVLNAYLGPVMEKYVHNFEQSVKKTGILVEPYITQSNGSVISIEDTIECPIKTAVSGPSAGVIGAVQIAETCNIDKVITFDMGGTSADISLIENGEPTISNERLVEGYPARIPMIDIITVGAGGGSIANVDEGGALRVGPLSAGASPGPACYMRGGEKPTVTDANIVLGKLNQEKILGGRMNVSLDLAKKVIDRNISAHTKMSIENAAKGIISVVNSNMIRAIRVVSVERGYDIGEFTLMAFGGAGPLHACEIAEELRVGQVLIPPSPGTLCSLGLLMADTKFDNSRSDVMIAEEPNLRKVTDIFNELIEDGNEMLEKERIDEKDRSFDCSIDCRYERQNYEIAISVDSEMTVSALEKMVDRFHEEHNRLYGYSNKDMRIQMVNYRVSAIGKIMKPELKKLPVNNKAVIHEAVETRNVFFEGDNEQRVTKIYQRTSLESGCSLSGPVIIEQMDTTSVIPPGWTASIDGTGNILVTKAQGK